MKRVPAALVVPLVVPLLVLAGCSDDHRVVADDRAPTPSAAVTSGADVSTVPPAPLPGGEVSATGVRMVRDDGGGPQLCVGMIMESYPPQCSGLELAGWAWSQHPGFEEQEIGGHRTVRWGEYAVSGRWDGTVLTVTKAVPARYASIADESTTYPTPADPLTRREERRVLKEVLHLPGVVSGSTTGRGQVMLEVPFDDGSVQAWADQRYGEHVVVITSALRELSTP